MARWRIGASFAAHAEGPDYRDVENDSGKWSTGDAHALESTSRVEHTRFTVGDPTLKELIVLMFAA